MTNIKRVLSLALAAVMLMGMMVIGAGAANVEYTDAESIENAEAVEVLTALDVLGGYPDGSFKPEGNITRAEAAAVICRIMLGADVAESLSTATAPFADVKATNWAAGYIAYLKNLGVISGIGNNKFNPQGNVTVGEFAKMLLGAAGIDGQFTGSSWLINVTVAAQQAGILTSGDVVDVAATRDAVAGYTLNTLFYAAEVVEEDQYILSYTQTDTTPDPDEVKNVTVYFDTYLEAYVAMGLLQNAGNVTYTNKTITKDSVKTYKDSLAEKVFDMTNNDETVDAFGRPATKYYCDAFEDGVVTYANDADYVFQGKVTEKDIYAAVGASTAAQYTWSYSVDGAAAVQANPSKTSTNAYATTDIGSQTEVFVNKDEKTITVVVINTFIGTVKKVTAATDAGDKRYVTLSDGKTFETESFAKNDVVLYTAAAGAVKSMELAEVVTGTLTKIVNNAEFTVGGVVYKVNATGDGTSLDSSNLNKEVSFYVDSMGNIMKDKSATSSAKSYIYVLGNSAAKASEDYITSGASTYTAEVYGVLSDGTVTTLVASVASNSVAANEYRGALYSYTTKSNGQVELTEVTDTAYASAIAVGATKAGSDILNSETSFIFIEVKDAANHDFTAENVTVKVGSANIGAAIAEDTAFIASEKSVAKYVFVMGAYTDGSTDSGDMIYLDATTETENVEWVNGTSKTTYSYDAYTTDGTKITVTSAARKTTGIYKYNADLTVGAEPATADSGVITAINGSTVTIDGDQYLTITDSTDEVYLNDDAELLVGQTVSFVKGTAGTVNANDIVAIWVTADQVVYDVELTDSVADVAVTTMTSEVIGGAGVSNTITITVKAGSNYTKDEAYSLTFNTSGTATFLGSSTAAPDAQTGTATTAYALSDGTDTLTFKITVTAPSTDITVTAAAVAQAA